MLDFETAKKTFEYDPETGILIWKINHSDKVRMGSVAKSRNNKGYRRVRFKGKEYLIHRVIWLLTTGNWPENQIDHINGIRDDNRLINLREATQSENLQNVKAYSNTGLKGIHLRKDGYYQVKLALNKKTVLQKTFKKLEDAVAAIAEAKRKYHTFHPDVVSR